MHPDEEDDEVVYPRYLDLRGKKRDEARRAFAANFIFDMSERVPIKAEEIIPLIRLAELYFRDGTQEVAKPREVK